MARDGTEDPRRGAPARFGQANVLRGLAASRSGEIVSLNLELNDPQAPAGRGGFERFVRLHNDVRPISGNRHIVISDDEVRFALQGSSQWDSFAHFGVIEDDGVYFGGAGLDETFPHDNGPTLGIQALGAAIVTRGVLIDMVAHLGFDARDGFLPGDRRIGRADVEECLQRQGVRIEAGDAVLVYTGFQKQRASLDGMYPSATAGVDKSTVGLWAELDIIALISDNIAVEPTPSTYDIHIGVLKELGIPLGELWALDELAVACRRTRQYDFCLTSVPLNIHGAFGSTANAVAIL